MDDDYAADDVELDADAEGELEQQGGSPGMTLVDAGGLSALGVPPPSSGASSALGGGGAGGGNGGVGKRYRPAPAKTFQCRGYGECRMVFSRSEHLARHVRKHTGERPFTCHCSKQFSRLDNLRQHAQTVHADKAALNEGMMRELTSLHVSMAGGAAASASADTAPVSAAAGAGGKKKAGKAAKADAKEDEGKRPSSKRAKPSAGGTGGAVKREPVDEQPLVLGGSGGMAQRPGTSTGYEGAAVAGYMDVDADGDEPSTQRRQQRPTHEKPSPPSARAHSFRDSAHAQQQQSFRDSTNSFRSPSGDESAQSQFFRADGSFRDAGADREDRQSFRAAGGFRDAGFRDANGGFRADGGAGGRAGAGVFRDREREGGAAAANANANANANTHSGGRQDSFRGVGPQFVRRSPPAHTPSPPTPSFGGNGLPAHRVASGGFSTGRPFSSGNGTFPAAHADSVPPGSSPSSFPALNGFPSSGSRPSTGSGARLPPLSAVVSASAFRPSSGHGLPTPGLGAGGGILLPNSLTLRRPSTSDWEWGDAWNVRPGTAPGKLATAAAGVADDSPFSFHPPEQPASSGNFGFGFSAGGGAGGSAHGNPRKRTLGGPDGPYGAHPDGGDGGYEYGGESRPQSRRLSVMELCNDEQQQRPASSSLSASVSAALRRSGSAERERPTTTNGLVSRASALVLNDSDQRDYDYERDRESQREHESRQYAAEQQHLAAERERERFPAIYGIGLGLGRHRAGSLRGPDAAPPGGAAATGARPATGGHGRGDGSGVSAAAGGGAAFLSAAAGGAGAPHRGGALSSAAAASAAPTGGVPRTVRASPPAAAARARDEYGLDGVGHGDDGGVSPPARAYGGGGRVSLSPPAGAGAYRGGGGLAGAGLPGGFGGVPHAHAPASPTSPTSPTRADAYRDSASPPASALRGGLLPGVAVFARVPAYAAAAGGVPLRGDDAVRFDDGIRYAAGGRGAEVRGGAAGAGHGPGGGYEYEYGDEYGEHGHGRRVGGGRSGGMRV